MANRSLGSITTIMKLNNSAFKKGLNNSKKDVNKFSSSMKGVGAAIGGAFAVRAVLRFGMQASKLAATMEGVAKAFDRIKPNIGFLEQLKTATAGTVSELDLMRRSVMASNFKIPLDQLSSLLAFATKRAQETGESVDYLVNSIVIGIGRKSPLILDNLGISAVELRQKLENVGHSGATVGDVAKAVGEIATESMAKMGPVLETTAIRYERLTAEIQNLKVEFGKAANEIMIHLLPAAIQVVEAFDDIGDFMRGGFGAASREEAWEEWRKGYENMASQLKKTIEYEIELLTLGKESGGFIFKNGQMVKQQDKEGLLAMSEKEARLKVINKYLFAQLHIISKTTGANQEQAKFLHKFLSDMKKGLTEIAVGGPGSIEFLEAALKDYTDKWRKATDTKDIIAFKLEIIALTEEIKNLKALGVPLPDIKEVAPWTDDFDMGGMIGPMPLNVPGLFTGLDGVIRDVFAPERKRELDAYFEGILGLGEGMEDVTVEAEKMGRSVGMTLVNSFESLGESIGKVLGGATDALRDLGRMILQNLGNILIMAGFQSMNIGMIVAGAAIQLGGGIIRGLGSQSSVPTTSLGYASQANVQFQISGQNLVGTLNRQNNRMDRFT